MGMSQNVIQLIAKFDGDIKDVVSKIDQLNKKLDKSAESGAARETKAIESKAAREAKSLAATEARAIKATERAAAREAKALAATEARALKAAERMAAREATRINQTFRKLGSYVGSHLDKISTRIDNAAMLWGKRIALGLAAVTTGAAYGIVNAQAEFEKATAYVRKATTASGEEFKGLESDLVDMSKTIPKAATELAKVMQVGAEAGVPTENLKEYTKVISQLSDVIPSFQSSDELSQEMMGFTTIINEGVDSFHKYASALVALENNGNATGKEIMAMSMRIAGAGNAAGLSGTQIMAMANTLSGARIEAEMGGSAMSRIIQKMAIGSDQIETGGSPAKAEKKLAALEKRLHAAENTARYGKSQTARENANENIKTISEQIKELKNPSAEMKKGFDLMAQTAGMTSKAFADLFKSNPMEAIKKLMGALKNMKDEGQSVFGLITDMDLKNVRIGDTVQRLSNSFENLNTHLALSNKAFKDNTALDVAVEKIYGTFSAKLTMFGNRWKAGFLAVKNAVLDPLKDGLSKEIFPLLDRFEKWIVANRANIQDWMEKSVGKAVEKVKELVEWLETNGPAIWSGIKEAFSWIKTGSEFVFKHWKGIAETIIGIRLATFIKDVGVLASILAAAARSALTLAGLGGGAAVAGAAGAAGVGGAAVVGGAAAGAAGSAAATGGLAYQVGAVVGSISAGTVAAASLPFAIAAGGMVGKTDEMNADTARRDKASMENWTKAQKDLRFKRNMKALKTQDPEAWKRLNTSYNLPSAAFSGASPVGQDDLEAEDARLKNQDRIMAEAESTLMDKAPKFNTFTLKGMPDYNAITRPRRSLSQGPPAAFLSSSLQRTPQQNVRSSDSSIREQAAARSNAESTLAKGLFDLKQSYDMATEKLISAVKQINSPESAIVAGAITAMI